MTGPGSDWEPGAGVGVSGAVGDWASRELEPGARIDALAAALAEGAWLWRPRPFTTHAPPWAERAPELAAFCLGLDDAEVHALEEGAPLPAKAPPLLVEWVGRLATLTALPSIDSRDVDSVNMAARPHGTGTPDSLTAAWMVPARKLEQVSRFADAVLGDGAERPPSRVLDWCGGKGHLGRLLGLRLGVPVVVLERESGYAEEAASLAKRLGVELRFVAADAMDEPAADLVAGLPEGALAVGLHACGVLGERLLSLAAEHGLAVAHSPCCLHKVPGLKDGAWRPMAAMTRAALAQHALTLDHSAMRLATSDEVVARPALRTQRFRENTYRLALDLLLQEASGTASYTPLGTLPAELVRGDFQAFAFGAAAKLGLELPAFDPDLALERGARRAYAARRLGLVRSLFRRAIEVLVALDRAAFLVESGYHVDTVHFAPRAVTPRNILILARRGPFACSE